MGPILKIASLAAAGLLASCVSVLPEQPVPNGLYRLSNVQTGAELQADLVVREPTAARIFAGQGMVLEGRDGALRLISDVEWAGRTTQLLKGGLIDAFSHEGPGTAVSDMSGASGDFEVSWRIRDLTVVQSPGGEEALCALSVTLLDGESRAPVIRDVVETRVPVSGSAPASRAQALTAAAEACLAETAEFIAREIETAYSAAEILPPEEAADAPD